MTKRRPEPTADAPRTEPDDAVLLRRLVAGDEAALQGLIDRYDRLVRYTIYRLSQQRCRRDPQWLDSLASEVWAGVIQSLRARPDRQPDSARAYLIQVARNRCIGALRATPKIASVQEDDDTRSSDPAEAADVDPANLVRQAEELATLRSCMAELSSDSKVICAQLTLIVERRWQEAAAALGLPESTLRSKWQKITTALQQCVERKSRESVAPPGPAGDP